MDKFFSRLVIYWPEQRSLVQPFTERAADVHQLRAFDPSSTRRPR